MHLPSLARRLALLLSPSIVTLVAAQPAAPGALSASALPALPAPYGFAGMYAGRSGGALVAAGGANFPDQPLAAGGRKVWHDAIFVLPAGGQAWRRVGTLPRRAAYGVSATWRDTVVCAAGSDAVSHFSDAWQLRWDGHAVMINPLPLLPLAVANTCGAVVGDMLYVCGGQTTPDATSALARMFALDLSQPPATRRWVEQPWPKGAPPRILAVAGTHAGALYLISGADLFADNSGKAERRYLTDAYRFSARTGWQRCADLPQAVTAAPSPAIATEQGLIVVGGVNAPWGSPQGPGRNGHGFSSRPTHYDAARDRWTLADELAARSDALPPRVTAPLVLGDGEAIIVSGEVAPGLRTPTVLSLRVPRSI